MRVGTDWRVLDETDSTQSEAAALLARGERPDVVFAHDQLLGRGRFDRTWHSARGESLTVSIVFHESADHPRPWLLGMAAAAAAAGVVHCQLRWPNDLTVRGLKLGGLLSEMLPDDQGRRVPVVGIGLNLNQAEFPEEIRDRATSLLLERGHRSDPMETARAIVERLRALPEPSQWADLAPVWSLYDATPGKPFVTPTGEHVVALGIGPEGELIASLEGETVRVLAGDALQTT